eukprot:CAMPEP_0202960474 /NCGR_PEP_ID=MMETSP1396-20130829/4614_1 /ASSEMBLY_ACC=CAM_ASM_000872 /TAXON_ID= /ORGANISM="Pseudokeronopsis sp., Strain Brazil" /LENGTH=82 /DNA_ID=CAMNT_0049679709 /DNA_START=268 /DNA_END=516 /DNA_ORIENTATION=+
MEEKVDDTPRIMTADSRFARAGIIEPKDVRTIVSIVSEHNRQPGVFDYNVPQDFYSTFPEIDREAYIALGSGAKRRVHIENQ